MTLNLRLWRAGKNGEGVGEEIFARESTGFPARPAVRGGHWFSSGILDKISSSEVVKTLKFYKIKFERGSLRKQAGGPLSYMFYIYILKSLKDNKTYVGYTNDLERRFSEHNYGQSKATKNRRPLELIFSEQFKTSKEAKKREQYWKSGGAEGN